MRCRHDLALVGNITTVGTNLHRTVGPLLCAGLLTGMSSSLAASDLFSVSATTISPTPLPQQMVTLGSNNFVTVLREVAGSESGFQNFGGTDFKGNITYGGVQNAAQFTFNLISTNGSPVSATFNFINGTQITFKADTADDLKTEVVNYFEKNGTAVLSSVQTATAVSDGNPNAASAVGANATFNAFSTTAINRPNAPDMDFSFVNPLNIDISSFQADNFSGYRISVPLGISYHIPRLLDDRVGLQLTGLFTYININSADIYQGGLFLGIPIQLLRRHALEAAPAGKEGKDGKAAPAAQEVSRLSWTVTPNGGAVVSGSEQFAQGGIIYLGGLSSALSYDLTNRITVTLGDSFSVAEGGALDIGNYDLKDQTDQVILKNGFSVSYRLTDRVALEAQALSTNFVNSAAIPAYATFVLQTDYTVPLGHSGRGAFVARIGFVTDQAPEYHSYGGRLSLGLSF